MLLGGFSALDTSMVICSKRGRLEQTGVIRFLSTAGTQGGANASLIGLLRESKIKISLSDLSVV